MMTDLRKTSLAAASDAGGEIWKLQRRVQNFLHQCCPVREVTVDAKNGVVTLRGKVKSFYDRQLCISATKRVPGVHQVVDQIQVEWPS